MIKIKNQQIKYSKLEKLDAFLKSYYWNLACTVLYQQFFYNIVTQYEGWDKKACQRIFKNKVQLK